MMSGQESTPEENEDDAQVFNLWWTTTEPRPQKKREKTWAAVFSRRARKRTFYIIMVAVVAGYQEVKVYVQVTGQTSGAHKTILGQLSKNNSTQVEFTNNVEYSNIVIVFCPIGSRAGSDVAAAMGNLPVSARHKPVVLVPMHHTRDHDYSVGKTWSEDNPGVVLEVHVLFHETQPGLLPCDRNKKAVQQIQDVLYKYSKHHNSCNP
ncbi:hypothetical protein INR49_006710 [Caranx melampygus]|nr:hypothetical protein INR49_006710 [Caranx melampygus]